MTTDVVNYDQKQLELIKGTYCKGLSEPEFALAVQHSKATGLSLLTKQLYAMVHNAKDPQKRSLTFVTSIDGYRSIAAKTGQHAGTDDAEFAFNDQKEIIAATVTVYRMVGGQRCPYTATARWSEYYPENYAKFWDRMPYTMLAKVAEALALRKAFPMELGGYYTSDEMAQAQDDAAPLPVKPAQTVQTAPYKPLIGTNKATPVQPKKAPIIEALSPAAEINRKRDIAAIQAPDFATFEAGGVDAAQSEEYVCQFGKWKGSTIAAIIEEHGIESLDDYVQFITNRATAENKPLKGAVKEFMDAAKIVLADRASFDPSTFGKFEEQGNGDSAL